MRRLSQRQLPRTLERGGSERGAVAVLVSLLLIVLVGFAALAVDTGEMWSVRKQLQNGADAAALAIAQACAKDLGSVDCVQASTTAQEYANANKLTDNAHGTVISIVRDRSGSVTVRASSEEPTILAGVLGRQSDSVSATATAVWDGSPSSLSTLPLIIGDCYLKEVTGGLPPNDELVRFNLLNSGNGGNSGNGNGAVCPNNQNNPPGGFGWLVTPDGACSVDTAIGDVVDSQTGKPAKCGDVAALLGGPGTVIQLPIFDYSAGQGHNATYTVIGYVALRLDSYCIDQQQLDSDGTLGHCGNGQQYLQGTVISYPTSDGGQGRGPDFGITFIGLTR